ncbi:interleukin-17D isoform X2 [Camelus ferus]|uniref:Interleukin-17D isoform X2 n=1 Tax=Camelus ferus TaxID=419612 RepID=A0A8B8UDF6_CAMFR|nr:interleukin-17D isoform X2 [Camelus ferus]
MPARTYNFVITEQDSPTLQRPSDAQFRPQKHKLCRRFLGTTASRRGSRRKEEALLQVARATPGALQSPGSSSHPSQDLSDFPSKRGRLLPLSAAPRRSVRTSPRRCDHRRHFGEMLGPPVSALPQQPTSPVPARRVQTPSVRGPAAASCGPRAPDTQGPPRGPCGAPAAPSQALAARGAAARPAHAHAHRAPAPRADPGSGRRRRGARGPARRRAAGSPRAARGRGGRAGAGVVRTHPPGEGAGWESGVGALEARGGGRAGGGPGAGRGEGARGGARAPPPRGAERGLSRRSGCWWPASCWRCRRAGRGAPRGRAGGRRGRGAARTGRRSSWSSCTGGWRPACSAPSTTRCSWARASRRATPAARPGAGPPTAASGRPPTCAACLRGPTDAAASLQNLSLARISYDPARYPKYLPEAYCLCRGCLTGPFGEEDFRFRSTPVFVPAVVLRRTPACAGGRSVYTEEYVTVPVGCTCVPEQEKEADSVNSSMDKPGSKLLLSPSDKPGRP